MTLDADINGIMTDLDSLGGSMMRIEEQLKGLAENVRLHSRVGQDTHDHVKQLAGSMRHIAELANQMERIADTVTTMASAVGATQSSVSQLVGAVDKHWSEMVNAVTGKRQGDWWIQIVVIGGLIGVIVFLALRISDKNLAAKYGDKEIEIGGHP